MKTIYKFLNGKCRIISFFLNAEITRWTAMLGLLFSPTLFSMGVLLENVEELDAYAYILYIVAALLFIPIIAEFSLTNKD